MRKLILFLFLLPISIFAQKKSWEDILAKEEGLGFERIIAQKIDSAKSELAKQNSDLTLEGISFCIDTFKIEEFARLFSEHRGSTASDIQILSWQKSQYEELSDKVFKKLSKLIKKEDQIFLNTNEKAWQSYKKSQIELIGKLSAHEYIGRGTINGIINSRYRLGLVVGRTKEIFALYQRIEENVIQEDK